MKRRLHAFLAVALLKGLGTGVVAQSPTFQSGTELVSLSVTVTTQDARPVTNLSADQFQIFEDGVQQEVKFFAPGEMPIDVVILLDTSASMTASMPLVQQAAIKFSRALRPEDRASVMGISSGLRVLQPFTADKAAIERAIQSTRAAGRTPLYASIYSALKEIEKERRGTTEPRRQSIVVLSDGQDTASSFGYTELMEIVRRHAVPIYTIAPRPTKVLKAQREQIFGEYTHDIDYELRKLAEETGARSFFPTNIHELTGVYDNIATELVQQYSLGYQSSNARRDGAFRRISLRVLVPGVKWRARAGYVADRDAATRVAGF